VCFVHFCWWVSIQNAAGRLSNFFVSLSDESPAVCEPFPGEGQVCAYYPGTPTETDITLTCGGNKDCWNLKM